MGPLKDAVCEKFPWLMSEFGFRVTRFHYDPGHMGSSFVEMESDSMRLRFVRDRGPVWIEVGARGSDRRFDLGQLWVALHGVLPEPALDGWAWFFREHRAEIEELMGPKLGEATEAVDRIRRANAAAMRENAQRPEGQWIRRASARRFLIGPLGWIVAGALLVWVVVR